MSALEFPGIGGLDDITALANPFGAPAKGKWNLVAATFIDSVTNVQTTFYYESRSSETKNAHSNINFVQASGGQEPRIKNVFTSIDQISDSGGRRLAKYEYPYLDGQKVKDLGRKAETYTFNIKFFGQNYQAKLKQFRDNVLVPGNRGSLAHPVMHAIRGAIDCRLETFEPIHRADESNAVTFRAVFVEDNSAGFVDSGMVKTPTANNALQAALQFLVTAQADISVLITSTQALLQTPAAIVAGLQARLNSIIGQGTSLLGSLAATFSPSSSSTRTLSASGATATSTYTRQASGSGSIVLVPAAFQTGLDANANAFVQTQLSNFVNANQVTTQQAVFQANQARASITTAIAEAEANFGNDAYDIVLIYRQMAVYFQDTVEACISSSQALVKVYSVKKPMSLRMIAFETGLDPDRSADIEALNPYLGSINLIPAGSSIVVPAS